jgi:outer membrane protein TolC
VVGDLRRRAAECAEQALAGSNEDLKAADARFREARALVGVSRSAQSPTVAIAPAAAFVRNSGNTSLSSSTLNPPATGLLALPLDLSCGNRCLGPGPPERRGGPRAAQASAADRQTVALSLQAELAVDYFELRSADAQRRLLDAAVAAFTEALQLTTNRFEEARPRGSRHAGEDAARGDAVQATDVGVQRARYEHAIATLLGRPPSALSFGASPLGAAPPVIPAGLPSQLLERRPTWRQPSGARPRPTSRWASPGPRFPGGDAERRGRLRRQLARELVRVAQPLLGDGPTAVQTLLDGGKRRAVSEAAMAAYDATVAEYRQATLTAFQQVENSLAALRILEQEAVQQDAATTSAKESLRISNDRYLAGADPSCRCSPRRRSRSPTNATTWTSCAAG